MTESNVFDVTIIGAGPAGLFSTFYSGLREMKTKVIESSQQLGGKLNVYTEKMVWDIGGVPPSPAGKIIDDLVDQANVFEPTIITGEKVIKIDRNAENVFVLTTDIGQTHFSKAIILATGYGVLKPNKLTIQGAETYELTNLQYTVQKPQSMKNKVVMISGGGDSAVDWANILEPIAKKVYLIYRQGELKSHEAEITKLMNSSVTCHLNTTIEKLVADESQSRIKEVVLTDSQGGSLNIPVDEMVINHGFESENTLFENNTVGLELHDEYYVLTNSQSASAVPGVFAAGDVVMHDAKLHLIAGAFQDAVNAVNQAKSYVDPTAFNRGRVSSHNDKFTEKNQDLIQQFFVEGK